MTSREGVSGGGGLWKSRLVGVVIELGVVGGSTLDCSWDCVCVCVHVCVFESTSLTLTISIYL